MEYRHGPRNGISSAEDQLNSDSTKSWPEIYGDMLKMRQPYSSNDALADVTYAFYKSKGFNLSTDCRDIQSGAPRTYIRRLKSRATKLNGYGSVIRNKSERYNS
ncbi:Uncharacterised protein g10572 [Pycnogonum litorale]